MATNSAIVNIRNTYKTMNHTSQSSYTDIYRMLRAGLYGAKNVAVFKEKNIEINGFFQRIIGRKIVDDVDPKNKVVKLNGGGLTFISPKEDIATRANNMIMFNEFLKNKNIQSLYIQAPHKTDKYNNDLPIGVYNYANDNADNFLKAIEGKIDFIDIREEMHKDGLNNKDYFFKTDHHWTPEGAFYAFTKVAKRLSDDYGFYIDDKYLDSNSYDKKILEKWFLGSQGKRVGTLYGGVDDISLIIPKFKTNFDFSLPFSGISRSGEWLDTVLTDRSNEGIDYYGSSAYLMYGEDWPLSIVKNFNSDNSKEILIIRDSFGCTFTPFLSLVCEELNVMDVRHYKNSVYDYVEENKPDMVLFLFNPAHIQDVRR